MDFDLSRTNPFRWDAGGDSSAGLFNFGSESSSGGGGLLQVAEPASKSLGLLDLALPGLGTALSVGVGGILGHLSDKYKAKQAQKAAEEERKFALQQLAMKMALERELAGGGGGAGAQKEIAAMGNLNNAYSNSVDAALSGAQVGNSAIGNFLRAIGR